MYDLSEMCRYVVWYLGSKFVRNTQDSNVRSNNRFLRNDYAYLLSHSTRNFKMH
jgi:hypothetical protein